jgi:antitoxin (DNA-binding transcriptional repressor) of toxin-antitoxin stability system
MAVMTISEARAALPEVVTRVAEGEEVTITRHGRPAAVVVRPDVFWAQAGIEVVLAEPRELSAALRERARRHGHSLEQEIRVLVDASGEPGSRGLPPIEQELVMGASDGRSTWRREEIYDDEGR